MALSIGVTVGEEIEVGDTHRIFVKTLTVPNLIVVTLDGGDDILITERESKEILPGVFVQVGVSPRGDANRLTFEADRSIRIKRALDHRR